MTKRSREERKKRIICDDDIFAERFSKILAEQKVTKYAIRADVGISDSSIYGYISGERVPSGKNLQVLCSYLGVSADYLLGLTNEVDTPLKWIFKDGECRCPYCDGCGDSWYQYCPNCGKLILIDDFDEEDL